MKITKEIADRYTGFKEVMGPGITMHVPKMGITELYVPEGVKYVVCWKNELTQIELPDTVTEVWGVGNPWDENWLKQAKTKYNNLKILEA